MKELDEKYNRKMRHALNLADAEVGHINCDDVLEELLAELNMSKTLATYKIQPKWYWYS